MVDSRMDGKSEEREAFEKISLAGLYIRNLGANLLGFMIIAVLNVFTPLEFFRLFRRFLFLEGYWKVFFLFFPFVFCLLILVQYRVQSPIAKARVLISGGDDVPEKLAKTAKQRLLNLPFLVVGINLAVWITLPALVVSSFYLFMDTSLKTCLFLYFRTFMIGLMPGKLDASGFGTLANGLLYLIQPDRAIHLGFAAAEQVQIGTVQNRDAHLGLQTVEPVFEVIIVR